MNLEALDAAIVRMHNFGAAYIENLLTAELCDQLLAEVDMTRRRKPRAEFALPTEPDWVVDYPNHDYGPVLSDFICEFGQAIRTNRAEGRSGSADCLEDWYPNEAVFQGYPDGGGITDHRDFSNCRDLIVIINVRGQCRIRVKRYSPDWVGKGNWAMHTGDVVLLRGAGFQRVSFYGRPQHGIYDCSGSRVSLCLRMLQPAA